MNGFSTKGKRTYNVSEIVVGDIVKFKGTRNKGIRRVLDINKIYKDWPYGNAKIVYDYFCRVLGVIRENFVDEPYTSTNSVDKLSHVFRGGTWFKVVKDQ